ncbi:glycosyltransferase involved in cell wall biosynthesis [Novosphingobium sp. PhB57]|uniref:glycosyltransferase family 4 protein n=1 Tax=Novosphingobium sp. PhB57 TaxID=2485107 RepID=UPI0010E8F0E0|nr:glycosyltransferase family 4 protein [Novosphingobium sp. PhB57]TCU62126.1 glycosyltransferase involved in cell wall biosynthesis [Novosphingobium sp. PhB57]
MVLPTSTMRIAILASGLGAGGAEQVIAQLAHHWCAAGHTVDVIAFDRPEDPVFHRLPQPVTLHRLGGGSGFAGMAGRVAALRRVLQARQPQVFVSFLTKNNLIAALATLGTPTRLVCAERNNPERQGTHPLWNLLLRLLYRRADAIVCQTAAVRRCFPAAVLAKLVTIANPVPAPDVMRAEGEVKRLCAVGRLTHQKGFDLLVQAFAAVAPLWPDWRLDIWGEGPERAALEAQVSALGLEGRVLLRGLSPRPRAWVEEAGIFVLSSRYEGFPNVLGEAMAAGLPAIAADCDFGPADMVEHGRSGLLVASEDTAALSQAMAGLIADPLARSRMGAEAAEAMARFQPARILQQWDQVLAQVVSPRHRGARSVTVSGPAGRRAGAEG